MRTSASLLSLALASLAAGCGDDTPDPQPYGGEVRVEHVRNADGSDLRRLSAFFIAAQEPDVMPEVALDTCVTHSGAPAQAENREYVDVGDSVTFHLGDGDVVVPRLVTDPDEPECAEANPCAEGVIDFDGRRHEVAYLLQEVGGPYGDDFLMAENTLTTAEPQSFTDQLRVIQPPVMEVSWPGEASGAVQLERRQDVELAWTQTQPIDDLGITIGLAGDDESVVVTCRSADTGHFTVPAALVDGLASETGLITVYSVSRATALTDDGRAVDVLAEYHGNLRPWYRR
ncbi:MAG TPA: hypothetical protein VFU21_23745 [Kofleriaceae bacterium]|nr:hypothetical protein [Kofleriaceae bacterium]